MRSRTPPTRLLHALLPLWALAGCGTSVPVVKDTGDTDVGVDTATSRDAPDIALDPASLDLGVAAPGEALGATFTVTNAGDARLESTVAASGEGFQVDTDAVILDAAGTKVITVSFSAATAGAYTGEVTFASNDPDMPTALVALSAAVGADQDGDGWITAEDCDDTDASVHPGAAEVWYDGVDEACDGGDDDDQDGDGVDVADDCDDTDASAFPGNTEVWYDGVDGDCSGGSDFDQDADGHDAAAYGGDDCDDTNAAAYPGAAETWYDGIDEDCSGGSDFDQDGDGHDGDAYGGDDCDDTNAAAYPGAPDDWYDGVDANCDGASDYDFDGDGQDSSDYGGTDCNDRDPAVYAGAPETWYDGLDSDCSGGSDYDADGDGYTASAYGGTDCDDTDAAIHPGAVETWYDGTDSDCSGGSDYDADGDGYTTATYGGLDCDDTSAAVSPVAVEVCDGVDDDCDGAVDEDGTPWYLDADGDGYGVATVTTIDCTAPAGYSAVSTDCLDADASVYPGAAETCNGIDDDCNGVIDDGAVGTEVAYDGVDNDCDGYPDDMSAEAESSWTVLGEDSNDAIGSGGVWTAGDLDGDGDPELIIGVPSYNYYYYYYTDYGMTAFHDVDTAGIDVNVSDGYYNYWGNGSDDDMGQSFAVVDDLDGDGYVEAAFGAYQNDANSTDDGTIYLIDVNGESGYDTAYTTYADGSILGASSSGNLGYSMAAGDFDGDGTNDLASGAPGEQSGKGRVYVTFASDGLGTDRIDDTDSMFYATGVSNSDHLGYSVTFGDFTADGYDDLVACAPDDDDNGSGSGTCWVVNGAATRGSTSVAGTAVSSLDSAVIKGSAASDEAGYTPQSLSVGDLDADGVDDLAVGVPGYDGSTSAGGGVWVYLGGTMAGTETVSTASYVVNGDGAFGTSVNLTGDVTGDGIADLLGGATTAGGGAGVVYLFAGGQSPGTYTLPADQYASWTGKTSGDLFGTAISGLQDLDADGIPDFAVSATGNDDAASGAGKVYVLPAYP